MSLQNSINWLTDEQFLEAWEYWGQERSVTRQLQGLVVGDAREVMVRPEVQALNAGTARTITKAWFSIKLKPADADATENATWSATTGARQSISSTNVAGRGQILSASEGSAELRFDLTSANTLILEAQRLYYFDVQVLMSDGSLYTVERGYFQLEQGITAAIS